MTTATVTSRQSLLDIAIQHSGSIEAAFEIAHINNLSLTDDLVAGNRLQVPVVHNERVAQYYRVNNIQPATAITTDEINDIIIVCDGIDHWRIGIDFIIS